MAINLESSTPSPGTSQAATSAYAWLGAVVLGGLYRNPVPADFRQSEEPDYRRLTGGWCLVAGGGLFLLVPTALAANLQRADLQRMILMSLAVAFSWIALVNVAADQLHLGGAGLQEREQMFTAREKHCAWLFPTNTSSGVAEHLSGGWQRHPGTAYGSELAYYRTFLRETLALESTAPPRLSLPIKKADMPSVGALPIGLVLSGSSTNWPDFYWRELAVGLVRLGKRLVLFGGSDAKPLAASICHVCPEAEYLTGRLGFAQSVAPLQNLELLIGNDTGFTHFASLISSRCLVIMGGGTFGRFFPWPEGVGQYVIFHGMDCFDCDWRCKFPHRQCLEAVSAAAVLDYTRAILQNEAEAVRNLNAAAVTCQVGWRRSTGLGRVTIGTDGSLTPSLGIDHG